MLYDERQVIAGWSAWIWMIGVDVCGRSLFVVLMVLGESVRVSLFGVFLLCFERSSFVLVLWVAGDEVVFDGFFYVSFADRTAHGFYLIDIML